jgi:hypothetical protein
MRYAGSRALRFDALIRSFEVDAPTAGEASAHSPRCTAVLSAVKECVLSPRKAAPSAAKENVQPSGTTSPFDVGNCGQPKCTAVLSAAKMNVRPPRTVMPSAAKECLQPTCAIVPSAAKKNVQSNRTSASASNSSTGSALSPRAAAAAPAGVDATQTLRTPAASSTPAGAGATQLCSAVATAVYAVVTHSPCAAPVTPAWLGGGAFSKRFSCEPCWRGGEIRTPSCSNHC